MLPSAEVQVKGKFIQVDNESLLLEIEESTLSSIGLGGSTPKVKFKLLGRAMELYNSRFSILVKKDNSKPADDPGTDGNTDDDDNKIDYAETYKPKLSF
mgnify:FL=1